MPIKYPIIDSDAVLTYRQKYEPKPGFTVGAKDDPDAEKEVPPTLRAKDDEVRKEQGRLMRWYDSKGGNERFGDTANALSNAYADVVRKRRKNTPFKVEENLRRILSEAKAK